MKYIEIARAVFATNAIWVCLNGCLPLPPIKVLPGIPEFSGVVLVEGAPIKGAVVKVHTKGTSRAGWLAWPVEAKPVDTDRLGVFVQPNEKARLMGLPLLPGDAYVAEYMVQIELPEIEGEHFPTRRNFRFRRSEEGELRSHLFICNIRPQEEKGYRQESVTCMELSNLAQDDVMTTNTNNYCGARAGIAEMLMKSSGPLLRSAKRAWEMLAACTHSTES